MEKKTIIFDLDGTLALVDKRVQKSLIPTESSTDGEGMDWDIFFDGHNVLTLDEPNYPVISMAQMYYEKGFNIVIFSGRNDRSYEETQQWLEEYEVPYNLLVLRPDKFQGDSYPIARGNPATPEMRHMPDEVLKKAMIDKFVDIDDVFMTVDDRQKVVDMWRSLGLTCFQVAPGDFK